ncbi:MAG TPA: MBL fold metallo-hydrolase [Bacillota bacterium]|nr:MBL fold metallo-hydrolase [Bacillota bacterium]
MRNTCQQLTDRIYYLPHNPTTDRPVLAAICGDHRTITIDAGNSGNHADLFLSETSKNQIDNYHATVLTHWHWDHSFGMERLNLLTIAHKQTKEYLEKMLEYDWTDEALDYRVEIGLENQFCSDMIKKEYGSHRQITIVPPHITFQDKLEIDLGNLHCTVKHVGGDHASDSSIIFVEKEGVLFLGDCLYPSVYTDKPLYTVRRVRSLLEKISAFDAQTYVLSHEQPLTADEFQAYVQLLQMICDVIDKHQHHYAALIEDMRNQLGRQLSPLEKEVVDCFMNGLE